MINPKNKLFVWHFDGSTYTDFSRKTISFGRDDFTITLETDDLLYIGYDKPINSFYMNLTTANTNAAGITMEYYDGKQATWVNVDSFDDDTNGFNRSAFLQWDRNLEDEEAVQPNVAMPTKFFYRITTDALMTAMTTQGINILFSDDDDLEREMPHINDAEFLLGRSSHVLIHESSRDEIVQRFANRGVSKRERDRSDNDRLTGNTEELIPWDLLEIQEIREASKFLALHKIMFNLSDNPDDVYNQKSDYYRERYEEKIRVARLTVDDDNDGIVDNNEKQKQVKFDRLTR